MWQLGIIAMVIAGVVGGFAERAIRRQRVGYSMKSSSDCSDYRKIKELEGQGWVPEHSLGNKASHLLLLAENPPVQGREALMKEVLKNFVDIVDEHQTQRTVFFGYPVPDAETVSEKDLREAGASNANQYVGRMIVTSFGLVFSGEFTYCDVEKMRMVYFDLGKGSYAVALRFDSADASRKAKIPSWMPS